MIGRASRLQLPTFYQDKLIGLLHIKTTRCYIGSTRGKGYSRAITDCRHKEVLVLSSS